VEDSECLVQEGLAEMLKFLPKRLASQQSKAYSYVMTAQGRWETCTNVDPLLVLWQGDVIEHRKCPEHKPRFIVPDGGGYMIKSGR
jgi:hypothetical protein